MMATGYDAFLTAEANDRRDAFTAAGARLGAAASNVEKDFWVCWTLRLVQRTSHWRPPAPVQGRRVAVEGLWRDSGFFEDVDVTVLRGDLVEGAGVDELTAMSGKKSKQKIEQFKEAYQGYFDGTLRAQLEALLRVALDAASISRGECRVALHIDDADTASTTDWPCETSTSTCRSFATISSGF